MSSPNGEATGQQQPAAPGDESASRETSSSPRHGDIGYTLDDDSDEADADYMDDADYDDEPVEDEDDDEDDNDDDEFHDAEGPDVELQIVFGNEDDEAEDDDDGNGVVLEDILDHAGVGWLSRAQLFALVAGRHTRLMGGDEDDDDEDELSTRGGRRLRRRRSPLDPNRFPKVPSEKGTELMGSGRFGANEFRRQRKKQLARRMLDRELGIYANADRQRNQDLMAQDMIPASKADMIVHYDDPVYSGQFSDDGNFFYSCGHDFQVRMYDTSNPYKWQYYKTVTYPSGQWTLTDASLSPDNRWLAYTSILPYVSLAPTDPNDCGDPYTLNLAERAGARRAGWSHAWDSFGIFSVRFSGDGRELVAGTNSAQIIIYDIESRTVLHSVRGHQDDVNAVCFADKSSPHILYSGSDDTTIKVWDRRSMADGREAGAFIGHTEGLTYIDSKGDGRYILSNGKDQTMKLWDLRMVMSADRYRDLNPEQHTSSRGFDYRWSAFREDRWRPHPSGDNSVVTFRGHKVLRTLIRCHFSPPGSTNSRYVYSGSQDGKVWVYNMDATVAGVIDVNKATKGSRPLDPRYRLYHGDDDLRSAWKTCVRDASWHPNAPVLVASAWNGINATSGTCSLHSYNEVLEDEAEPRMGCSYDEQLNRDDEVLRDVLSFESSS